MALSLPIADQQRRGTAPRSPAQEKGEGVPDPIKGLCGALGGVRESSCRSAAGKFARSCNWGRRAPNAALEEPDPGSSNLGFHVKRNRHPRGAPPPPPPTLHVKRRTALFHARRRPRETQP